jgi:autotransporter adhesin
MVIAAAVGSACVTVTPDDAMAWDTAWATGVNTTAVGQYATASGDNSVAVGALSRASGANTTAIGNLSAASSDNSTALGVLGTASGVNSTAFGNLSLASGANSSVVGILSTARGSNATAVGNQSAAKGSNSTALGTQSLALADDSIALGDLSVARGIGSSAIGNGATALGANSIAIGSNSIASSSNVVSFGSPGAERRLVNIAAGVLPTDAATYGQLMTLASSINVRLAAIDQDRAAVATAHARVSAGFEAVRTARNGPMGSAYLRGADRVVPLVATINARSSDPAGPRTIPERRAGSASSNPAVVAVGRQHGAVQTGANAARAGTGNTVGSAAPVASAVAAPAIVPTQGVSAAGGAGSDIVTSSQLQSVAGGLQAQIAGLQNQIDDNRREARAGTALALASSGLQYDTRPGKASLAAAVGYYKGQSGLAVGLGYAVTSRWRINAAFTGTPQVNDYGAVAGTSWTLN